ncbi:hypothetical protein KW783_03280 [Candidatus Parcubacteria bacterium]|nr:hypothetical protein [Candidatus Parcubacteria bacterium]
MFETYLYSAMPPIYSGLGRTFPWGKWGWCNLYQMVEMVNHLYGLDWTDLELLTRFGLDHTTAKRTQLKFGLQILEIRNAETVNGRLSGEFTIYPYNADLILRFAREGANRHVLFVPAGWAKEVMWILHGGCRRIIVENATRGNGGKKIAVAAEENGDGVWVV